MDMEGQGRPEEAKRLFETAWNEATNDLEKFTAAHYVARHQTSVADKLHWDQTALRLALNIKEKSVSDTYPSLYLNVARCYEELGDEENALKNYQLAFSYCNQLSEDGYGKMIKGGISKAIERLSLKKE